ncbi:ATPase, T2SS/T4P/T4SS family [Pelagibius sp. Alg239-R121]|uniref:ATPase, T2SS/T4P/T4SS family n=1 Tax=Pelagibius sp. Alg239-R121 TaxID=2993448 RepID=UPI0024A66F28|nr:ATPase, T2SS/T4P/T4SS family [Pelagibius sp. Alg239-R121]
MSRYLERNLREIFRGLLADPDLTEIVLNPDCSVWVARNGDPYMRHHDIKLSKEEACALTNDLAGDQPFSEKKPYAASRFTLEGSLWRSQVLQAPIIDGPVAFALRRTVVRNLTLHHLIEGAGVASLSDELKTGTSPQDEAVFEAYDHGFTKALLHNAVRAKWNILLSGGTDSGKTTWLRACLECADPNERIVTIEDTQEIFPAHPNSLCLLSNGTVSSNDLLKASLRLRPDRILMGELRGTDAYDFLSAINSGHPGGITTVHASSPERAMDRLAFLVMQANLGLTFSEIVAYCRSMIDLVIQFDKIDGMRKPTGIRIFRKRPEPIVPKAG